MVLRPVADGKYQIVGECLVYGLHDAISLLGPLPDGWNIQVHFISTTLGSKYYYYDEATDELTEEDPRLEPLVEWERVHSDRTGDDPETFQRFKDLTTGEVINYDPRMSPEALRKRGVPLEMFSLI